MIKHRARNGDLEFVVRVVPRASRSEVIGEHDGALRVRIAAPPVDGAANDELIRLLRREFKVGATAIEIAAGHSSKTKQVRIKGLAPAALAKWNS